MSATRSVETTGPTIEEAIQAGLDELNVPRESVIVEILEEPSRGLLGLGSREALVRLTTAARPRDEMQAVFGMDDDDDDDDEEIDDDEEEEFYRESQPRRYASSSQHQPSNYDVTILSEDEASEDALVGKEKLEDILRLMEMDECQVAMQMSGDGTPDGSTTILQIEGDELGNLIGRKGDTLATLQYVTRLITSHALQRRVNFVVDAGDYKLKREETLRKLAYRTANRAVERRRTIKLDPMPAHERRIIHMALRQRDDVTTRSEGEGDYRKVTIIPRH